MRKRPPAIVLILVLFLESVAARAAPPPRASEQQVTRAAHGHILTNTGVWSPDSRWIVYDVRSDPMGDVFDGTRIERVRVDTGEVEVLYASSRGACCGIATWHPSKPQVAFVLGPELPTPDWSYDPCHRQGILVDAARPGEFRNLDARDLTPPFTPGALRGGSHVHVFSPDGAWVSFTYEDHVLAARPAGTADAEPNQRNVGVAVPAGPVRVDGDHPRNQDGKFFCVLVTRTVADPRPGSDEISRACEEAWIGTNGYVRMASISPAPAESRSAIPGRPEQTSVPVRQECLTYVPGKGQLASVANNVRQRRALAFQGLVRNLAGADIAEVFVADLPDDLTVPGDGPLEGTATRRPLPPRGVVQRRLTFTADRTYPGLQGPRHWLRSSPDGSRIACLMRDDSGVVQLWMVSPAGGPPAQLTRNAKDIASAFTWSPDGRWLAHAMDGSVCVTDTSSGQTHRLTAPDAAAPPSPLACVFSPDGRRIAYLRPVAAGGRTWNQVFCVAFAPPNGNVESTAP
jgi:hypothetical protein